MMTIQDKTKYLFYQNWPDPEIEALDYWLEVLEDFISIALDVGRVPVIPIYGVPDHKKKLDFQCENYIDLTNTEIYKVDVDGQIEKLAETLQWLSETDATLELSEATSMKQVDIEKLYEDDNEKYKFLSLDNIKKEYTHPKPCYYVKTTPSKKVNQLTDKVLTYFETTRQSLLETQDLLYKSSKIDYLHFTENLVPYACLNLHDKQLSINKPSKVLDIIENIFQHAIRLHKSFKNIYLVCKDRKFRFPEIPEYKVYTYHDFPELNSISSDNYLLYSVEKNIFAHAVVKIYPPGANKLFYAGKSRPKT